MKLKFKEQPSEWRKSTWLTLGGLLLITSLLRWRHAIFQTSWLIACGILIVIAILAFIKPGWFRGYYRISLILGFYSSQFVGWLVLFVFFLLVLTPVGLLMRVFGKDPMRLRRAPPSNSYWETAKESTSLDSLF